MTLKTVSEGKEIDLHSMAYVAQMFKSKFAFTEEKFRTWKDTAS